MMEEIVSHVVERLSNPEVLFGLAVRFFGVFLVLIIVMIVLYTTGWLFQRFSHEEEVHAPTAKPGGGAVKPTVKATPAPPAPAPSGTGIPDEVAVAIALSLVPDEVAVAVAMALTDTVQESAFLPLTPAWGSEPARWQQPESAWKLLGRQQALFRKTSLTRDITPKGE